MEQLVFEQVIGPVVKFFTSQITKHLGYVTCSTKHVSNMNRRMKVLENTSADIKNQIETNNINNKEIPTGVTEWLNDVEDLKGKVQSFSSDIGCFNMKMRYQAGRNASKATEAIEELITKNSGITWTDAPKPTGRVDPKPASSTTSTPSFLSLGQYGFKSREGPFNDALKFLQQEGNKSQVIALCGMGGVGKTTMMEQLKTVAYDKKLFHWIVKVVIGRNPNMLSIQNDIALCLGGEGLREATATARAESLRGKFKEALGDGKKKILVILDDVWQKVELKDFGLTSPLGDGFKLLLTSRDSYICTQIAADAQSVPQVVRVDVLQEAEACNLFSRFTGVFEEDDHDRYQIGCDIVKKCGGLPLAIKLIGTTLNSQEYIYVWRNMLNRLKNNDYDDNVQEIIKISYEHIKEDKECGEIFLHCGLFPEDADIPIEELTRYAWGLRLLKNSSTLIEARARINTCVSKLINASLLINSDRAGCVKMHDLVLAFVLGEVSKGDRAWIINHGDLPKLDRDDLSDSCERISLTCMGMCEFPRAFKYPNLSFLQLMHGDRSLRFPIDFYDNMENLKVIAYYEMQYPLLPRSLQCSITLKSLCLYKCKLTFDCSFVENLVNLELLSFAYCGIRKLPSKIRNLRKLKLLDITGCVNLRIDDGVFQNLDKLEELYMRVSDRKPIRFTDSNLEELKMLSSKLCALEIEFFEEMTELKNMQFSKLDKFVISMGCLLEEEFNVKEYDDEYSFRNTLKLVAHSTSYLLDCKINELFKKTEKLYIQVKDMIGLEDIVSIHPHHQHSFYNLRDLEVFNCAELKYLFSIPVANGLRKLERLKVSSCYALEALVKNDGSEINSAGEMLKFVKLKALSLANLPKLVCLFLVDYVVELSQLVELEVASLHNFTSIYPDKNNSSALLNNQVKIAKLEKLEIRFMVKLEQIWACGSEEEVNNISTIREIEVCYCDSLVNLFPTNPMRLLNHLERLEVSQCGSIEEIFNIDLECLGKDEQLSNNSSLRSIDVSRCEKVREVWRIKGGENNTSSCLMIHGFEAVETISICQCKRFRNVFTPINIKFDMRRVVNIRIQSCGESGRKNDCGVNMQDEEARVLSTKERDDNISAIAFPSSFMHSFHHLNRLVLQSYNGVEVVFEIESSSSSRESVTTINNQQPLLLPNLQYLLLSDMESMSHVWKCDNRNKFSTLQKQSLLLNLQIIRLTDCNKIKYLFSPLIVKLLSNLKEINTSKCDAMEVVFEIESPSSTELVTTTEYQPPLLPNLQVLELIRMNSISHVWKCGNWNKFLIHQKQSSFHNLTLIYLLRCHNIKYLFSPLMAKLLSNLKTIEIFRCSDMEEVVSKRDDKDEDKEMTTSTTYTATGFFPHLHSLSLELLDSLKCIGGGDVHDESKLSDQVGVVSWSLCQYPREIYINSCDKLSIVIPSHAAGQMQKLQALKVKYCESLTEVFQTYETNNNSNDGITNIDEGNGGTDTTTPAIPRPENINVPQLCNLKKLELGSCNLLQHVFTFSTLESLRQLEELMIEACTGMKVIVKKENGDQEKVVVFPRLKSLTLYYLPNLNGFFLGMNEFQWPLLEKVMIGICPQMTVFTRGRSTTPKLKYIHTHLGKHSLECNLNFHVTTYLNKTWIASSDGTSFDGATLGRLPWSLHNLIELCVEGYSQVRNIVPSNELLQLQMLEMIRVKGCNDVEEVFEVESQTVNEILNIRQVELENLKRLKYIWKSNGRMVLGFPNLTTLCIRGCNKLEHVFNSSMVGSLSQLQELHISDCQDLEVIIKEEEESEIERDAQVKEIVTLPCLKSLKLEKLENLKGFCLGEDEFSWPSLDNLEIRGCPKIAVFTKGHLATPALSVIDTSFGRCYTREDVNYFIKTYQLEFSAGTSFLEDGELFG